jgi:hypothetical protein
VVAHYVRNTYTLAMADRYRNDANSTETGHHMPSLVRFTFMQSSRVSEVALALLSLLPLLLAVTGQQQPVDRISPLLTSISVAEHPQLVQLHASGTTMKHQSASCASASAVLGMGEWQGEDVCADARVMLLRRHHNSCSIYCPAQNAGFVAAFCQLICMDVPARAT